MGEVVILPVIRRESEDLAAQEARRLRRWDPNEQAHAEARERAARLDKLPPARTLEIPLDDGAA